PISPFGPCLTRVAICFYYVSSPSDLRQLPSLQRFAVCCCLVQPWSTSELDESCIIGLIAPYSSSQRQSHIAETRNYLGSAPSAIRTNRFASIIKMCIAQAGINSDPECLVHDSIAVC